MIRTGKIEMAAFGTLLIAGSAFSGYSFIPEIAASFAQKPPEPAPIVRQFVVPPTLETKAAYVVDTITGEVLYALNATTSLPLASVTKLMTALTASEQVPPSTVATIRSSDIVQEGDSGLYANERWSLKDLVNFTLFVSSNDGASALASASMAFSTSTTDVETQKAEFIGLMNQNAQRIGLSDSTFINESGLDVSSSTAGGYGSAKDVAALLAYILRNHPEIAEATSYERASFTSIDDFRHPAKNTNEAINAIPGIIGSKTGLTDLAGGNLVVGIDIGFNHPVVIAVLGSTEDGRFSDVEALASSTLAYFQR